MKHLLNNMSEEEKNAIREQHAGGMKVMTENFNKLLNSKLGDSKPLISEQTSSSDVPALSKFLKAITGVGQNNFKTGWIADPTLPESKNAVKFNKSMFKNEAFIPGNMTDGQPMAWSLYPSYSNTKENGVSCVITKINNQFYINFKTTLFQFPEMKSHSFPLTSNSVDNAISYLTLLFNKYSDYESTQKKIK
jgi:hypothetical protein